MADDRTSGSVTGAWWSIDDDLPQFGGETGGGTDVGTDVEPKS